MSVTNRLLTLVGGVVSGLTMWKLLQPEIVQRSPSRFLATTTMAGNADAAPLVAVVTGASAGIGKTFAERLAQHGYNLVLVARRKDRLDALAAELKEQYSVDARPIVADLANATDIERVAAVVSDLSEAGQLDLLVNNAGFGTVGTFAHLPIDSQLGMINVHIIASVQLARAALPGMIERGRGGIINVASVAGWYPLPGNVTYSATKRYLTNFSQALQSELDGTGVYVQALCPGFTYSEFHDTDAFREIGFRRDQFPAFLWQSAEQVVEASLNALGREVVCVPGIHNRALILAQSIAPRSLLREARRSMQGWLGD